MNELNATGLCPVCRCEIASMVADAAPSAPDVSPRQCLRCETFYHQDCWDYSGGCAIFGCAPAAPGRPCPVPRAPVTLGEQMSGTGVWLAGGALLWTLGGILGLLGWFFMGPLVLPALMVLSWLTDPASERDSSRLLRLGALFGPLGFVLAPIQMLITLLIPLGLIMAVGGQVMRVCAGFPRVSVAAFCTVTALLSWSHAPDQVPVPFTSRSIAARREFLGYQRHPYLVRPAAIRDALVAPLGDDTRVLVMPHGTADVHVARVRGRIQVTHGTVWRPAGVLVLPAGDEPVELVESDGLRTLLGPRLDDLLRAPGRPARLVELPR